MTNEVNQVSSRKAFTAGFSKPVIAALATWAIAFAVFFAGSWSEKIVVNFLLVSYMGISVISILPPLRRYKGGVRKSYLKGFVFSLILMPVLVILISK